MKLERILFHTLTGLLGEVEAILGDIRIIE
jgi:hypothetical protein